MLLRFRTVVAAAMLTVAAYATAVEVNGGHPDTYVVRKGDTLWDIAARFLQKPWLWPEIWQANPQIANPHLIYPGDVLSLAYLDRVTVSQAGPRQEAPIDAIPLAQVEPFLKQLSVVDSVKQLPYVVGLEDSRLRVSGGDTVYVRLADAQVGQRWAVVRPTVRYAQPKPTEDLTANGDVTRAAATCGRPTTHPTHVVACSATNWPRSPPAPSPRSRGRGLHAGAGQERRRPRSARATWCRSKPGRTTCSSCPTYPLRVSRAWTCACWRSPTCSPPVAHAT